MSRGTGLIWQRKVARHAEQRLMRVIKRAGQQQRFRLFDAKPRGEMTKIVVNRQRRGGKNPAPRFLRHHLFEFFGHGQRRQRQSKVAGSAFVPVAEARLVDLFQSLEPRTIDRRAFKGGIQQRRTPQRQFCHVIAQLQRIIEQQQRR